MKYVLLSKNLENSHINHTNSVFYKNVILWSIDRSLRPTRKHMTYFASLGIFMGQGRRTQRYQNPCMGITGLKENLCRNDGNEEL